MQFVTDFADEGVVLPMIVAVALTLLVLRERRMAKAWVLAMVCVVALTLASKLAGYAAACLTPALARLGLVTPSGHVAASAAAYGGLLGILLRSPGSAVGRAVVAGSVVSLVVGTTRVLLREHTIAESLVGAALGTLGSGLFACLAGNARLRPPHAPALAGVAVGVALLCHGMHFSPEQEIHAASNAAVQVWLNSPREPP